MTKTPVRYSDELAEEICITVSTSPKMLEELCAEMPHWPCAQTIYEWRIVNEKFGEMYARAKCSQIEPLVSTILEKARDRKEDFYDDGDGVKINYAHLQRLRIETDAIKWFAAKLAPKLYGDKVLDVNVGGTLLEKVIDKL